MLRYDDTKTLRFDDTTMQRFYDTKMLRYDDVAMQRFYVTKMLRYDDATIRQFDATTMSRCNDSTIRRCYKNAKMKEKNSKYRVIGNRNSIKTFKTSTIAARLGQT